MRIESLDSIPRRRMFFFRYMTSDHFIAIHPIAISFFPTHLATMSLVPNNSAAFFVKARIGGKNGKWNLERRGMCFYSLWPHLLTWS